ncbi:TetR/AcrR family transcriptional regulator C-terminal domain-containing protein [Glycomyces arizonensis]|uniref:TetR/AcrR family transcriptional regulator C-terminal domain-containing protein n=1 Tax=Glycomyces arizonensis TaxID=256035 RepID=UPI000417E029|nr:GntR family transcriptional regulator [Glycomyces arizonensis]
MTGQAEPPYARIAAELGRRITERELAPGDKVPSTRQVAQEFGVALATAAKALGVLRAEGLVHTRPRSGTVVAPRRSARGSGEAAAELTRARVLAEAAAIADAQGLEAVSMRAVAGRCGIAPMSLYRHVEGKDELVMAMADSVYGTMSLEDDESGPWRERIETLTRALWRLHRAHPWLGRLHPLTRPLPLPNLLVFSDRLLGALDGVGLPPKLHFDVQVLLYSHVVGLAANFEREDEALSATGLSSEEWTDLQYVPTLNGEGVMARYPHFAKFFGHFASLPDGYDMDLDEMFELGLTMLLNGLETLAARGRTASASSARDSGQ